MTPSTEFFPQAYCCVPSDSTCDFCSGDAANLNSTSLQGKGPGNKQPAFTLFPLPDLQLVFPVGKFHLQSVAKEAYLDVGQSPSFQRKMGMSERN